MHTTDIRASSRRDVPALLLAVLGGAVAGALGVWFLTRGEVDRLTAAAESSRAEVAAGYSREALLTSRLAVDRAIEHLDARNFGLMMQEIEAAGISLARVDPAQVGGLEPLEQVRGALDAARRDAGTFPDAQRALLLGIEGDLEGLGAPRPPGTD